MKPIRLFSRAMCWLGVLGLWSGCARDFGEQTKMTLQVPKSLQSKSGTLAVSGQLVHIIINVKGDGMSTPVIWSWDGYDPNSSDLLTPPSVIAIEVPSGPKRLIQYLGVYRTPESLMQFTYGDAVRDLSGGDMGVDISAFAFGSSSQEGLVAGRLLTGADSGPTATLVGAFQPPATASSLGVVPPPMEVMTTAMFDGWFKLMMFDGAPMTWRRATGEVVFDSLDLNSPAFANMSGSVFQAYLPAHKRAWPEGNETISINKVEAAPAQKIVFGFFGPGVGSSTLTNVCYTGGAGGSISGVYPVTLADSDGDGIADSGLTPLAWNGSMSAANCTASSNLYSACRIGGGTPATCSGTEGVNFVKFDHSTLGQGKDGSLGFNGPFTKISGQGGGDFVYNQFDGSKITIGWKFLSAVVKSALRGVSIYYDSTGKELRGGGKDHLLCNQMALQNGFQHLVDVSTPAESYAWSNFGSINPQNTKFILCPYRNSPDLTSRQYFPGAVSSHGMRSDYPVTQLALQVVGGFTAGTDGACYPIEVLGLDRFGNVGYYETAPAGFNLTASGGAFYFESTCTNPLSWSPAAQAHGYKKVYFKSTTIDTLNATATGLGSAAPISLNSTSANYATPAANAGIGLIHGDLSSSTCEEIYLVGVNGSGELARFSNSGTANLDDNAAGGSFFSDEDCQTPITSRGLSTQYSTTEIYYRNNAPAGTTINLRVTNPAAPSVIYYSEVVTLAGGGAPAWSFTVVEAYSPTYPVFTGLCYPVKVQVVDGNGNATFAQSNLTYTITSPHGGHLYTNPTCSGAYVTSASGTVMSGQMYSSQIYIIPLGPSSAEISVSFNDFSGGAESFSFFPERTRLKFLGSGILSQGGENSLQVGLFRSDGTTAIPATERKNIIPVSVTLTNATSAGIHELSGQANVNPLVLAFNTSEIVKSFKVQTGATANDSLSASPLGDLSGAMDSHLNFAISW